MNEEKAIMYTKRALRKGQRYFIKPLPPSITWLYGLGFKVGILLLLKSYLVIRNVNMSVTGFLIVLTELIVAAALTAGGILIQHPGILDEKQSAARISCLYGGAAIIAYLVNVLRDLRHWAFFAGAEPRNPFFDFLNKMAREAKNFLMTAIFMDIDLIAFFCTILAVILILYIWARERHLQ